MSLPKNGSVGYGWSSVSERESDKKNAKLGVRGDQAQLGLRAGSQDIWLQGPA